LAENRANGLICAYHPAAADRHGQSERLGPGVESQIICQDA
jgi:hypothetical protein